MTTIVTATDNADFAAALVWNRMARKYHVTCIFKGETKHLLESSDVVRAECFFDGLVDGYSLVSKTKVVIGK